MKKELETKTEYLEPVDIQKFYPLHVNHGGHPDNGRIQIGSAKDYIAEMYDDEPCEGEDYITEKESHALADELVKRYNKFPALAKALQDMILAYKKLATHACDKEGFQFNEDGCEPIETAKQVLKEAGLNE